MRRQLHGGAGVMIINLLPSWSAFILVNVSFVRDTGEVEAKHRRGLSRKVCYALRGRLRQPGSFRPVRDSGCRAAEDRSLGSA